MHKMWEIRESSRYNRSTDSEVEEAYECGYEEGYRKAMRELRSEKSRY